MEIKADKAERKERCAGDLSQKILTVILTVILAPLIAAYCVLWAAMTVGGGAVKRILGKYTA